MNLSPERQNQQISRITSRGSVTCSLKKADLWIETYLCALNNLNELVEIKNLNTVTHRQFLHFVKRENLLLLHTATIVATKEITFTQT